MTDASMPSTLTAPVPSRDSIMDQLRAAWASVTESEPASVVLDESSRLREDLGLDSFAALELIFELEEQAGVRIPQEAASSFQTVGDVISYVLAQRSAAPIAETSAPASAQAAGQDVSRGRAGGA